MYRESLFISTIIADSNEKAFEVAKITGFIKPNVEYIVIYNDDSSSYWLIEIQ